MGSPFIHATPAWARGVPGLHGTPWQGKWVLKPLGTLLAYGAATLLGALITVVITRTLRRREARRQAR